MQLFQNILSTLSEKILLQQKTDEMIVATVNEVLGTALVHDQMKLRSGVLTISAAPTIKLTIKLKERPLCAALQEKGFLVRTIR